MNQRRFLAEALIVAGGLLVLVFFSAVTLRQSLEVQNERAMRRLQKAISTIVERAHHGKDDVAIQETVHGLGEAPGVFFAAVVSKEGNFLAHSQPTLLGKPFHRSRLPLAAYALHEGADRWGTLVFALSDPSVREGVVRQVMVWVLGGIFLWAAWVTRYWFWNQRLAKQEQEKADLSTMLEEQKRMLTREEGKREEMRRQWIFWLQSALEQMQEPVLLLDHTQRVVALSPSAGPILGAQGPEAIIGRSWQDMERLLPVGPALQQSLERPGTQVAISQDGTSLVLWSLQTPGGNSCTWIRFKPLIGVQ
jgi:PAS domain-containing protein